MAGVCICISLTNITLARKAQSYVCVCVCVCVLCVRDGTGWLRSVAALGERRAHGAGWRALPDSLRDTAKTEAGGPVAGAGRDAHGGAAAVDQREGRAQPAVERWLS